LKFIKHIDTNRFYIHLKAETVAELQSLVQADIKNLFVAYPHLKLVNMEIDTDVGDKRSHGYTQEYIALVINLVIKDVYNANEAWEEKINLVVEEEFDGLFTIEQNFRLQETPLNY